MNKILLIAIILISVSLVSCQAQTAADNAIDQVDSYETCVAAGNPILESYPEQCYDGENRYVNKKALLEENRVCTREYEPVCAKIEVQCITVPCDPIYMTFSNSCLAGDHEIIYEGQCEEDLLS